MISVTVPPMTQSPPAAALASAVAPAAWLAALGSRRTPPTLVAQSRSSRLMSAKWCRRPQTGLRASPAAHPRTGRVGQIVIQSLVASRSVGGAVALDPAPMIAISSPPDVNDRSSPVIGSSILPCSSGRSAAGESTSGTVGCQSRTMNVFIERHRRGPDFNPLKPGWRRTGTARPRRPGRASPPRRADTSSSLPLAVGSAQARRHARGGASSS